ncbi:hypothetical protein KRX51_01770 [Corynebacterium sp. TAE3-ERU12]|uniref:hypothetical protein n=1 Tax=Corynebacterium sp. TAE3-ERU12 TaxID=2849491 RepID=UPI001C496419|nr:hypothetical protein [Corynebacterium sp. TAE3-ERU12]MBV7294645.1 hypothetical protein [Corynebacterium sp. TAE3-ERU12]
MSSKNFDNEAAGVGDDLVSAYDNEYNDDYVPEAELAEEPKDNGNGLNWPTVAAAAGIAVLVAALITTIGVVGAIRGGDSGKDATIAMYEQMLASQNADNSTNNSGSANRGPSDRADRDRKSNRSSGRSSNQGRSNNAASGTNPARGGSQGAQSAQQDQPAQPADNDVVDEGNYDDGGSTGGQELAPNWGPGNLDAHLQRMMAQSTSDQEIANGLEAGNAGVPVIRSVQTRLNAFRLVYSWELDYDSVYIDGDTLFGDLILTLSGYGSKNLDLQFYDIDATWKLSNESLCKLAESARTDCPV